MTDDPEEFARQGRAKARDELTKAGYGLEVDFAPEFPTMIAFMPRPKITEHERRLINRAAGVGPCVIVFEPEYFNRRKTKRQGEAK